MFDTVENSVWHAFDFMAVETNRTSAKKSKLKVIGGWEECREWRGGTGGRDLRGQLCYRLGMYKRENLQ